MPQSSACSAPQRRACCLLRKEGMMGKRGDSGIIGAQQSANVDTKLVLGGIFGS